MPLQERTYADACDLTWENVYAQLDEFVWAHALGWWAKSLLLRDPWFCWILSIMFEVMEYSLAHQLPNFAECWWDHWILDVALCNALGIWLGMKTCEYFKVKTYSWRGIQDIPSVRGKVKRTLQQFSPYSWTVFEWAPTESWKRYVAVLALLGMVFFSFFSIGTPISLSR